MIGTNIGCNIAGQVAPSGPITDDGPVFASGGGVAPAGPWDPLSITTGDVIMWLDPQAGVTMDGSNNVTQWVDQGPDAHTFVPNSAPFFKPVYDATAINSNPGMTWIQFSSLVAPTTFTTTGGRYRFVVLQNEQDPTPYVNNLMEFGSGYGSYVPYTDEYFYEGFGRSAGTTAGDPSEDLSIPYVYSVFTDATTMTCAINGTNFYSGAATGALGWPATLQMGTVFGQCYVGNVGDIIVVDSDAGTLSGADFTYLLDGLKTKYGIT
jgi:hypothetical protein